MLIVTLLVLDVKLSDIKMIGKSVKVTYNFNVMSERTPTVLQKSITFRKHGLGEIDIITNEIADKLDNMSMIILTTNYPITNGIPHGSTRKFFAFWKLNRGLWRTSNQDFFIKGMYNE